ncbi:putative Protein RTF2-like protein [Hypsibius exemplaris]|uniref:Replication termination factor 2 n=1 Tax=Hypsibius exemplaris TaxID=2072580 RepID=A0A9X6RLV0_HYPEX|nr:putative Protein RTF2-like protein [Hypsibius exemplaris]
MGNDGGTIARRVELVRTKKKPQQKDKDAETAAKWKYCQISQEPLRPPIVACDLGRLYNKDSVLVHLLSKKAALEGVEHIKSMKDVTELRLTEASKTSSAPESPLDQGGFHDLARWVCPVTGLEMTGRQLFSFLKSCGCVISDRALKALKSETCPNCNKPYNDDQVIPINPGPEELTKLRARMELRKSRQKADKKASKDSRKRSNEEDEPSTSSAGKLPKTIAHPVTSSSKDSKDSGNVKHSLTKDTEVRDLVKKSIAEDPKSSTVFKSLFTSCDAAKSRKHANWVTYNPYY